MVRFWMAVRDDQHNNGTDYADGMPTLFPALDAIGQDDVERIIPNLLRQLERHAVLGRDSMSPSHRPIRKSRKLLCLQICMYARSGFRSSLLTDLGCSHGPPQRRPIDAEQGTGLRMFENVR